MKYKLGSIVYLRMSEDQRPMMVLERHELLGGSVRYVVSDGAIEKVCYSEELAIEEDILMKLNANGNELHN